MHLTLSPARGLPGHPETELSVTGDVLTHDGAAYDLSPVPEGGEGWPEGDHPFCGPIRREGGLLHVSLRVVLDDSAARDQPTDRAHWTIQVAEGPVVIPALKTDEATA